MKPLLAGLAFSLSLVLVGCADGVNPTSSNVPDNASRPAELQKGGQGPAALALASGQPFIAGGTQTGILKVWRLVGPGSPYTWTKSGATLVHGVALGDADGDHAPELVAVSEYNNGTGRSATTLLKLEVYKNGMTTPDSRQLSTQLTTISDVTLGELRSAPNAIVTLEYKQWEAFTYSSPAFSPLVPLTNDDGTQDVGGGALQVGDATGDGVNDVVVAGSNWISPGGGFVAIHDLQNNRLLQPEAAPHAFLTVRIAKLGGLLGDTYLLAGGGDNKVYAYRSPDFTLNNQLFQSLEGKVRDLVAADFDNDGLNEVAVAVSQNQPPFHKVYVFRGGPEGFTCVWSQPLSGKIFALAAGDASGDAVPELAVAWANGLQVYRSSGNGATLSFSMMYADQSVKDLFAVAVGTVQ